MPTGKTGAILVIEDDPGIARLEQKELERAGYSVLVAHTAEEALDRLAHETVDLILLDYFLPGQVTGLRLYKQLQDAGHHQPVIVVTGSTKEELVVWALRAGVRDFVTKSAAFLNYVAEAVERVLKQVRTEREFADSQTRLVRISKAVDSTSDAVHMADMSGASIYHNPAFVRLYRYEPEELNAIGGLPGLFAKPDVGQGILASIANGQSWSGEAELKTKGGAIISALLRANRVVDEQGNDIGVVTVATDVTERKSIQAQLLRAQRLESIGTLAGGIAHDLNNVLTPILMAADLLKTRLTDAASQSLIETLQASAERGAEMVKQVLLFARGMPGQRLPVQIRHVIRDLERMVSHTFPKSIELCTQIPADTWSVTADATQLHQLLMNLSVNARDAMPRGGLLTISVENRTFAQRDPRSEATAGPYVVVTVADTGTGMPAEIVEKIFDPFFTTKEIGKGTGLGLSTALAIVKSHHGFINVSSERDRGTRFDIMLPALEAPETTFHQLPTDNLPSGSGEMVLLVDDEPAIREITKATLSAHGYRVTVAHDGAEALALFAKHQRDVQIILVDMMMPIMDGPATIRALKEVNLDVRVIAMSGLAANGKAADAEALGVQSFVSKPYTAAQLLAAIHDVLRRPAPRGRHAPLIENEPTMLTPIAASH